MIRKKIFLLGVVITSFWATIVIPEDAQAAKLEMSGAENAILANNGNLVVKGMKGVER